MSKVSFKKIGGVALILASLGLAGSALAAQATGDAKATVLTPIAIEKGQELNFGVFSAPTAGTVVISSGGARSQTGGVVLVGTGGQQGTFTVTGTGTQTFGITYPGSVNLSNGSETMALLVTGASSGALTGGTATINVGGTLTVGANQAAGEYTGTYTMTVEYN